MARTSLGTATTDSNGIARLTDAYTGTGAGKVDFSAAISASGTTYVSELYEIIDGLFFDEGISSNNQGWGGNGNLTTVRGDEYTTLSPTDTSSLAYTFYSPSVTNSVCFELDLLAKDHSSSYTIITIRDGSTTRKSLSISGLGMTSNKWYHLKVEMKNGQCGAYVDGVTKYSPADISSWDRFQLQIASGSDGTIQFKNFVAYPI